MHKNIKRMFLLTTLVFLLVGLSALTAADLSDDSTTGVSKNVTKSTSSNVIKTDTSSSDLAKNTNVVKESAKKSANIDKNSEETKIASTTKNTLTKKNNDKAIKEDGDVETELRVLFANQDPTHPTATDGYVGDNIALNVSLINVADNTLISGENVVITVANSAKGYNKEYSITTDGTIQTLSVPIVEDMYEMSTINGVYLGSDTYKSSTASQLTLVVDNKDQITLTVDELDFDFDDDFINGTISPQGTLTDDSGNPLTGATLIVYLNDDETTAQEYVLNDDNYDGKEYSLSYKLPSTPSQGNLVTVKLKKSDSYDEKTVKTTQSFDIDKMDVTVTDIVLTNSTSSVLVQAVLTKEDDTPYDDKVNITVFKEDGNQIIPVKTENVTLTDGNVNKEIDLTGYYGDFKVLFKIADSDYYNDMEKASDSSFRILVPTTVTFDPDWIAAFKNKEILINGTVTTADNTILSGEKVDIIINDTLVGQAEINDEGEFQFPYTTQVLGENIGVEGRFNGNDYFAADVGTASLNVELQGTSIKVGTIPEVDPIEPQLINSTIRVNGTVNSTSITEDVVTGKVKVVVTIEDEDNLVHTIYDEQIELENGKFNTEDIKLTHVGEAKVEAQYLLNETAGFDASGTMNIKFSVELLDVYVTIAPIDDVVLGEITHINASFIDSFDNPVNDAEATVVITDESNTEVFSGNFDIVNGVLMNGTQEGILFNSTAVGTFTVDVSLTDDTMYYSAWEASDDDTFNVLTNSSITISTPYSIYVNDTYVFTGDVLVNGVPAADGGSVKVFIDGVENTTVTTSGGKYTFDYRSEARKELVGISVVYQGEEGKVANATNSTRFTVDPHTTFLVLDLIDDPVINQTFTISGNVTVEHNDTKLNGKVLVKVGDKDAVEVDLIDGVFTYDASYPVAGNIDVIATFVETPAYDYSTDSRQIEVEKLNVTIDIDVDDVIKGEEAVITATFTDENGNPVNGKATVTVTPPEGDAQTFNVDVVNGAIISGTEEGLKYPTQIGGMHNVTIVLLEDENYVEAEEDAFFFAYLNSSITVNEPMQVVYVNDTYTINGTLTVDGQPAAEGSIVKIYVDDENVANVTTTNGLYSHVYTPTTAKDSIAVKVEYAGVIEDIVPATNETWFTAEKHTTFVELDLINNTVINKTFTISGNVTVEHNDTKLNGTVLVKVGESSPVPVDLVNGVFTYETSYPVAEEGVIVIASFVATDVYDLSIDQTTLDVEKLDVTIDVTAPDVIKGEEAAITAQFTDENNNPVNGKANVIVTDSEGNDHSFTNLDVVDGNLMNGTQDGILFPTTVNGIHNITVELLADENYVDSEGEGNFTVLLNTSITVNEPMQVVYVNDTYTINGTLTVDGQPAADGSIVKIYVDDENVNNATTTNGVYSYDYVPTQRGEKIIVEVIYEGVEGEITSALNETWFIADPHETQLELDLIDNTVINKTFNITGRVNVVGNDTKLNGTVFVTVGSRAPVPVDLINGEFNYSTTYEVAEEAVPVIATFYPSEAYDTSVNSTTVDVEKLDATIEIIVEDVIKGEDAFITTNITDENGNPVNGKANVIVTDSEGVEHPYNNMEVVNGNIMNGNQVGILFPTTADGLHNITVELVADDNYVGTEDEGNFLVFLNSSITVNEPAKVVFVNDTYTITGVLSVDGTPVAGRNVTVNIRDGETEVTQTVTTTEGGVYTYDYIPTKRTDAMDKIDVTVTYGGIIEEIVPASNSTWFIAEPHATTLVLDPIDNTVINKTFNITGRVSVVNNDTKLNGTVFVTVGSRAPVPVNLTNGEFNYSTTYEVAEEAVPVTAVFYPSEAYDTSMSSTTVDVEKLDATIEIEVKDVVKGEEAIIKANITDENGNPVNGKATVTVTTPEGDVQTFNVDVVDGALVNGTQKGVKFPTTVNGTYNVTVELLADDNYVGTEEEGNFLVFVNASITVNEPMQVVYVNDTYTITGVLTIDGQPAADGTEVTVTIGEEDSVIVKTTNGVYSHDYVPKERKDSIPVKVEYAGIIEEIVPAVNTTWFIAEPHTTQVEIDFIGNHPINTTVNITGRVTVKNNDTKLNGTVKITVGNEIKSVDLIEGEFNYSYDKTSELEKGIEVIVVYEGNEVYDSSLNKTTFDIEPLGTITNVNPKEQMGIFIGDNLTIKGNLTDETGKPIKNATLTFILEDEVIGNATTDENGEYIFTGYQINKVYDPFEIVTVEYDGSDIYTGSSNTFTFSSEKRDTLVTIDPLENSYLVTENITISGTVTERYDNTTMLNGTASLLVDGVQVGQTNVTEGKYAFNYTFIPDDLGDDTSIEVVFTPSSDLAYKYDGNSNKTIVGVEKLTPQIAIDPISDKRVDKPFNLTGTVTDDLGKPVNNTDVTVVLNDGTPVTVKTDKDGKFSAELTPDTLGENNITVSIDENDYHDSAEEDEKFNVHNVATANVTVDPIENPKVDKNTTVTGKVVDEYGDPIADLPVNVTVNGQTFNTTTNPDGTFALNITPTTAGTTNVTVEVPSTPTVNGTTQNQTVDVAKQTPTATMDPIIDPTFGKPTTVSGTIKDENGNPVKDQPVTVVVNGQPVTTKTDENGKFSVPVTPLVGTNNVTVSIPETDKIAPTNVTKAFEADKVGTKIINLNASNQFPAVTEPITIFGNLVDEDNIPLTNAPVSVRIGDKVINTTTGDRGRFTVNYTPTEVVDGLNITASFAGNGTHYPSTEKTWIDVEKLDTTLTVDPIKNPTALTPVTVSGTLKDERGNPVKNETVIVTVDGVPTEVKTDNNGKFTTTFTPTESGPITVTVSYQGDGEHIEDENTTTVNVNPIPTKASFNPVTGAVAGSNKDITGKVTDANGKPVANKPVTVNVNGKNYTATTDSNGNYKVTANNIIPGLNTVTTTIPGDKTYANSTTKSGFNALNPTKAQINVVSGAVAGSNQDITGKVTDINGKPVPNKTVTVNVNGKNYPTTTDSNGNYKVTANNIVPGLNSVTVTVPGDKTYQNSTLKSGFNALNPTKAYINGINNAAVGVNQDITGKVNDINGKPVPNEPVTVTLNGKNYPTTTDSNGNYKVTADNIIPGQNNVTVNVLGDKTYAPSTLKSAFTATNPKITINSIPNAAPGDNVTIRGKLTDGNNKPLAGQPVTVKVNNKEYNTTTNANGDYSIVAPSVSAGTKNVTATFKDRAIVKTSFKVEKLNVNVTVPSVVGKVGEKITLTAKIFDQNGNPVTSGNIVFKLNGRSLRTDGRFDTNTAPALKLNVVNGTVTYDMTADLYLRYGKNITASYSGSFRYNQANGNTAEANIQLRDVKVKINVKPTSAKQNTNVTFNAFAYDVTKNAQNKTIINENATMMFKVNGKTLTDKNGKAIKVKVVNGSASYNYYIARGVGGIDNDKNVRNYTVTAVYSNTFFYPDNNKNTTNYTVQRSPITINIQSAQVKNNLLTVKANITDYQGALVVGTNKVCIKVNGATYKENGAYKYWSVKNGVITLSGIKVSATKKLTKIELVTGERQAYLEGRATSTNIVYA